MLDSKKNTIYVFLKHVKLIELMEIITTNIGNSMVKIFAIFNALLHN